jgi:GT2 family glycosyltransferase
MMHLRRTDYISGACLVMRRQLYMAIGGLDDRFGQGYYEDTDLAMSVRAHGLHVAVQPLAVVYHQEG